MEVLEAIMTRRSIRRYKTDPIDEKTLSTVLEAARWAPSWSNTQCWRFIVVRDAGTKNELSNALLWQVAEEHNPSTRALRDAPVVIVACAQLNKSGYYHGKADTDKGDWFMYDVALAMENLSLAAHSLGLGTVQIGLFDAPKVAALLGMPEGFAVVAMTPLGYPEREARPVPRKEITEIVFHEKFGTP